MQGISYGSDSYASGRTGYQTVNKRQRSSYTGNFGAKVTTGNDRVTIELPTQDWKICENVDKIPSKYELKEDGELGRFWRASGAEYKMILAAESTEENPVVVARGVDDNGRFFEKKIEVRKIDPYHTNRLELDALEFFKPGEYKTISSPGEYAELGLMERFDYIAGTRASIADCKRLRLTKEAAWRRDEMDFVLHFTENSAGPDRTGSEYTVDADILSSLGRAAAKNLELYSSAARERMVYNMSRKCTEELSDLLWKE